MHCFISHFMHIPLSDRNVVFVACCRYTFIDSLVLTVTIGVTNILQLVTLF